MGIRLILYPVFVDIPRSLFPIVLKPHLPTTQRLKIAHTQHVYGIQGGQYRSIVLIDRYFRSVTSSVARLTIWGRLINRLNAIVTAEGLNHILQLAAVILSTIDWLPVQLTPRSGGFGVGLQGLPYCLPWVGFVVLPSLLTSHSSTSMIAESAKTTASCSSWVANPAPFNFSQKTPRFIAVATISSQVLPTNSTKASPIMWL